MLIIFILFLVLFNIFQFSKIRSYKTITKTSDNEFGIQLELICHGIETIEEAKVKDSVDEKILGTAILSSATGQATSVYIQTSYYEENKLLYTALWNLNNTISNNTRINNLLETHDFSTLIPIIRPFSGPLRFRGGHYFPGDRSGADGDTKMGVQTAGALCIKEGTVS